MKIRKDALIEEAAHDARKDKTCPVLAQPYLDGDFMVATDGRILAAVKVEREEGDADGPVSVESLKAARKAGPKGFPDAFLKAGPGSNGKPEGAGLGETFTPGTLSVPLADMTFKRPNNGGIPFPNWRAILPEKKRAELVLTLDSKALANLVAAVGPGDQKSGVVTLHIPIEGAARVKKEAIRLDTYAMGPDDVAVIMPRDTPVSRKAPAAAQKLETPSETCKRCAHAVDQHGEEDYSECAVKGCACPRVVA